MEHAHLAFTLAVQRELAAGGTSSACWSPYSVASALGLAATGARGATRDELATLLVGSPDGSLTEHGAMLGEAVKLTANGQGDPPILGVSNTLWARDGIQVRPEFTAELGGWPNGAVQSAAFATDPDGARRAINADVASTTRNLIPQLIGPGMIDPDTVATLVNALYLKVSWRHTFPVGQTGPAPFHGPSGAKPVATMRLQHSLGYVAADGWQVVVLPAGADVDAVVLLPDGELAAAEATLTADTLAPLLAASVLQRLDLYLPRFRVRAKAEMEPALRALGVHTMYDPNRADFSGIADVASMYVSAVLHEAVLTIDEQGLEGAAATAIIARALSMSVDRSEPVVVRVDRPFLFLVRHRASGAVYFMARVLQP